MDKDDVFNDEANDFEKTSFAIATYNFSDGHKLGEEGFDSSRQRCGSSAGSAIATSFRSFAGATEAASCS
uniref:Uncharacterized protein n=1 Tax=Leersia perrieri TaxID=77586 RepID=A0A0D9XCA4_9ORYZ